MAEGATQRNEGYKQALADLVAGNHRAFARLRSNLTATYWLLLFLLTVMFLVGVFLVFNGGMGVLLGSTGAGTDGEAAGRGDLVSLGAGGVDLMLLGLARPVERIRQIKNDRAQLFILLSDYHVQTTTALLWYDATKRDTILQAADRIRDLTIETIHLIESYMQVGTPSPIKMNQDLLDRMADQNEHLLAAVKDRLGTDAGKRVDDALSEIGGVGRSLRRSPRGIARN